MRLGGETDVRAFEGFGQFRKKKSAGGVNTPAQSAVRRDTAGKSCGDRLSTIAPLLGPCGPLAIRWFVPSVVVDSFQRMTRRRSISHVFQEPLRRLAPARANRDSTTAVILPARMIWIGATLDHRSPSVIFDGPIQAVESVERFTHLRRLSREKRRIHFCFFSCASVCEKRAFRLNFNLRLPVRRNPFSLPSKNQAPVGI